jgi:hypothetical protein
VIGIPEDTTGIPELDETLVPVGEPTLGAWGPPPY